MALTDLDQRGGSHLARLPLVARCQPLEFGENGIGFDTTSGKKLLDVVNLRDHKHGPSGEANGRSGPKMRARCVDHLVI